MDTQNLKHYVLFCIINSETVMLLSNNSSNVFSAARLVTLSKLTKL